MRAQGFVGGALASDNWNIGLAAEEQGFSRQSLDEIHLEIWSPETVTGGAAAGANQSSTAHPGVEKKKGCRFVRKLYTWPYFTSRLDLEIFIFKSLEGLARCLLAYPAQEPETHHGENEKWGDREEAIDPHVGASCHGSRHPGVRYSY